MTEEDEKRPADGPAANRGAAPANDPGEQPQDRPGDRQAGAEFPDEPAPESPEERLAAVEAELADTKIGRAHV